MDRQYLRPRMSGAGTVVSEDRFDNRTAEWPETDRERPVKSILRKPLKLQTRPRRNSDSSIISNLPAVGSDSEAAGPSTPPATSSGVLPRKVLRAKLPGAVPEERRGVVNLRSSRASSASVQSGYHVPPVRTVLSPSYPPDNRQLDRHDRRVSRERNDRHGYDDRDPETESVSESSELSTTTQATTVASALSDFEGSDVTPTEAPTKSSVSQVRFTPSVIGSSSSVVSSTPPSRKVRPRLGTRVRPPSEAERPATKSIGRSVNIKLLPPSPVQSGEFQAQRGDNNQKGSERSLVHKIEQLEAETRGLRVSQARLEKELEDSSSVISSSGKEKAVAMQERDRERADKAELLGMVQEQTAIVDELRSNLELQKGLLDEVEKERDAVRTDLQSKLDANKKLLEEFSCTFELQKVMLKEAEKERDEIKEAKDKADARYLILEEEFEKFRRDRKAQEDVFIQQIVSLEINKDGLQKDCDSKSNEITELTTERDNLRDEVTALSGQVTTLTDDNKALDEELQKAKAAAEEEQQALKGQIEELQKAKEDLEATKAALEEEKAGLETKLDTAQGEIATLNSRIGELEASASEFDTTITGKEEQITTLQTEAADLTARIDGLETDKAELQKQVEDLGAQKAETQAELHGLNTDLAGSKAANVSLATQKLELQEWLAADKAKIEKLTEEKAALQAEADKLPDLESTKAELESAKGELEGKISELETKLGELQAEADKVPGLSTEKDEVSGRAAELESKITDLEAKIGELQSEADKVPSLADAKSSLEAQLAEIQAKISTLQAELDRDPDTVTAALKAEVEANRQEITRRVEEISSLTESNSTLSTQLGATQQQLSAVQQSLDSVTASYTQATEQVIELQARVEQLSITGGGLRSRRGSRSRNSSPQKKEGRDGKKDKQLVVVRNPTDRGAVAVMLQIVGGI